MIGFGLPLRVIIGASHVCLLYGSVLYCTVQYCTGRSTYSTVGKRIVSVQYFNRSYSRYIVHYRHLVRARKEQNAHEGFASNTVLLQSVINHAQQLDHVQPEHGDALGDRAAARAQLQPKVRPWLQTALRIRAQDLESRRRVQPHGNPRDHLGHGRALPRPVKGWSAMGHDGEFLSHFLALRHQVENSLPFQLALEDDLYLRPSFTRLIVSACRSVQCAVAAVEKEEEASCAW